jgi:tetratricopeptide (TPR) repeat protein
MSSATLTADKHQAAEWLRRGQAFEAGGDPGALTQALACYDQSIALLRTLPLADVARELALAHMNRGNALQKLARLPEAVAAYDHAIAGLTPLAAADPAARNSLGAAWMNRGHALQHQSSPAALAEALRSHDQAIRWLRDLADDDNPSYRANHAGAWLNRAQVLLTHPTPDLAAARAALDSALALLSPAERHDPLAAELSLKSRLTLCALLARQFATTDTLTETSDTIDASLELVRHWESRGLRHFRPLAQSLYRFGAQFYLAHQPQFLAEFLLENLDPTHSPGAMPDAAPLHTIAAAAIARAQSDNYNRLLAQPTGPESARLQEISATLHAAETRRLVLQQAYI